MRAADLLSQYRRGLNPPYSNRDLIIILGTLFILIAIPATVFLSGQSSEPVSRAKAEPVECFPSRHQGSAGVGNVAVVPPSAHPGIILRPSSIEDQTQKADTITVAKVQKINSRKVEGTIVTDVGINVEQIIKGDKSKKSMVVTVPGGQVGEDCLYVGGVPNFIEGERTLLFLKNDKDPRLVQYWQSKYSLAGKDAIQPESEGEKLPIKKVEERVGRSLGKQVIIEEKDEEVISTEFTTFCPAWTPSQTPVVHEANPANPGPGGPTGNNFVRLVYTSNNNWQKLPDSRPAFSMSGATTRSGQDHFDRNNTIAWSNLGSGVLGVNYCATQSGGRIDSDTLISTSFTWDADSTNGVSGFSLEAVLEHELGHGLGAGHSDQPCNGSPSTPLMCPAIASGGRKTILADDQAAAAFLYPLSGSAPGAPSNLNVTNGPSSNSLSWSAGSGSTFATEIERSDTGCSGTFKSIQTIAAGLTNFVDDNYGDGLSGSNYCYRIKALGTGGDSAYLTQGGSPPDTQNPTVTITSPTNGSTVANTITMTANASDNVGVTRVEFFVNGAIVGTDTSSPYSTSWDTTTVSNGNYNLTAKAYDAAGNAGNSSTVVVSVNNNGGGPGGTPGDLNNDFVVNVLDLSILLSNWQTNDETADINNDGVVNVLDLSIMLTNWS